MKAVERDDLVADVADEVERRLMRTLAMNDRLTELEARLRELGAHLPKPPPVRHLELIPEETPDALRMRGHPAGREAWNRVLREVLRYGRPASQATSRPRSTIISSPPSATSLAAVDADLLDGYVSARIQAGLHPKTVTNHLLMLNSMLRRAVRWRLIPTNPVEAVDRPKSRHRDMHVLTEAEIARLWTAYGELEEAADDRERPWYRLARLLTSVARGAPSGVANYSGCAGGTCCCSRGA